jgi:nitrite reductase (NADH) small subunit
MNDWIDLCALEDVPLRGARVVHRVGGEDIAVFRTGSGRVFALRDRCPHKGGPLSQGIVHGERVTCPMHGWTIALDTGEAVAPDRGCARHLALKVDAGRVMLDAAGLRASAPVS